MKTDIKMGLSTAEVTQRIELGQQNVDVTPESKSIKTILLENICTLFNLINIVLAVAVFLVGSYRNALFMGVVICNLFIGIVQEIRAKRSVDRLSLMSASGVNVIRNSKQQEIPHDMLVLDDIVVLKAGDNIKADCVLVEGDCDVNESFITGEAVAVEKKVGDNLLAGSFVVSGVGKARVQKVGEQNYIAGISSEVKYVKKINSEIMTTLKRIIKGVSIVIIPVGILLFLNQFFRLNQTIDLAVVNTVAALIGMIPEGLMLLTSTVLAVAVIRLSKSKVLVQSIYCIETLARVDVLCLDKTGTITEGALECCGSVDFTDESTDSALFEITNSLCDQNPVFDALLKKYGDNTKDKTTDIVAQVPFDSTRKWSGVTIGNKTIMLGAVSYVCELNDEQNQILSDLEKDYRVLVVAKSKKAIEDKKLSDDVTPIGLVLFRDKIRDDAKDTMEYFTSQDVTLKVISGDSAKTVSEIAKRAGIPNYDKYIDISKLDDDELKRVAKEYTVFGRVTPQQKKVLVVALQNEGHTVAMTGDGVNDVMALKQADCSIAMATGTEAARNVSELVLLNSDFSALPKVVEQGRQSINNIQRSASLFLVKTIYSVFLSAIFMLVSMPYPFVPIQLTLISALTIGIPSFVLALEPNHQRISGNFFRNILKKALAGGLATVLGIIAVMISSTALKIPEVQVDTIYVITAAISGVSVLFLVSFPFNKLRAALFAVLTASLIVAMVMFNEFFVLAPLSQTSAIVAAIIMAFVVAMVIIINRLVIRFDRYKNSL